MERRLTDETTQPGTLAQAVWETLTETQKAVVLQAVLQVCQQLVAQWKDEAAHEHVNQPG
jgi:hypothetical protein